jgi:sulfide:quinone oxidoreductase
MPRLPCGALPWQLPSKDRPNTLADQQESKPSNMPLAFTPTPAPALQADVLIIGGGAAGIGVAASLRTTTSRPGRWSAAARSMPRTPCARLTR